MNSKSVISLFLFLLAVISSAYAAEPTTNAVNSPTHHKKLTTINADNVDQLIIVMSDDFFHQLAQIKTQYKFSREHRDARSFLFWRLRAFMPTQTQLETYYQTVFSNNKKYLASTDVEPLLPALKHLSDVTISLIEAIRDDNSAKMDQARKQINDAVASYDKVIKAHNLNAKIKRK